VNPQQGPSGTVITLHLTYAGPADGGTFHVQIGHETCFISRVLFDVGENEYVISAVAPPFSRAGIGTRDATVLVSTIENGQVATSSTRFRYTDGLETTLDIPTSR
jgi:hypothetical protein